jgi:hypothetical protein
MATKTKTTPADLRRRQRWNFTTAAGELREYEIEHIADHVESPGRRVRLRRLGLPDDDERYASVYEGWMHEGERPGGSGIGWELAED